MKRKASPLPPVPGTVATRTRRQEKNAAAKWNQPLSVIINILLYADPETVRILCLLSKQFLDIIRNSPAMKNHRVIPLLQISPSEDQEDPGRTKRLIHQLHQHRAKFDHRVIPLLQIKTSEAEEDDGRLDRLIQQLYQHRAELQQYRAIKFLGVNKFFHPHLISDPAKHLPNAFQLHGVVSLDISSPTEMTEDGVYDTNVLPNYLTAILPNLLEINFSNTKFDSNSMRKFCGRCPRLERITWNNIKSVRPNVSPWLNGSMMHGAKNLTEIYMDDCEFFIYDYQPFITNSDGDAYSEYIFHCCCENKVLERVSIKNAVVVYGNLLHTGSSVDASRFEMKQEQDMLIKFVRKAPTSLKWFRSDLTQGNINMLESERPDIEFVS